MSGVEEAMCTPVCIDHVLEKSDRLVCDEHRIAHGVIEARDVARRDESTPELFEFADPFLCVGERVSVSANDDNVDVISHGGKRRSLNVVENRDHFEPLETALGATGADAIGGTSRTTRLGVATGRGTEPGVEVSVVTTGTEATTG